MNNTTETTKQAISFERKPKAETAWCQKDETNFINGLGTHTGMISVDLDTLETLLNRYRLALCKRATHGKPAGFNIRDALKLVDLRLDEVRTIRDSLNTRTRELVA